MNSSSNSEGCDGITSSCGRNRSRSRSRSRSGSGGICAKLRLAETVAVTDYAYFSKGGIVAE